MSTADFCGEKYWKSEKTEKNTKEQAKKYVVKFECKKQQFGKLKHFGNKRTEYMWSI